MTNAAITDTSLDEIDALRIEAAEQRALGTPLYVTEEAIDRNPWAAVILDLPKDASKELLERVTETAFDLMSSAYLQQLTASDPKLAEQWRELAHYAELSLETAQPPANQNTEKAALDTLMEINYDIDPHPELSEADIRRLDSGLSKAAATSSAGDGLGDDHVATGPDLPPDPEGMNEERAAWALHAVRAFQDATGTDDATAIGDLLADMMHLCDRMGDRFQRFSAALSQAEMHYEAETARDPEVEQEHKDQSEASEAIEPMTLEAIERDHAKAVTLDLPPDADKELLEEVYWKAHQLERSAELNYEFAETREEAKFWAERAAKASARMDEVRKIIPFEDPAPPEAEPFTEQDLYRDPWSAVYQPIPAGADQTLLELAHMAARRCQASVAGGEPELVNRLFAPTDLGKDAPPEQNFERATERLSEIEERLDRARIEAAWRGPEFSRDTIAADPWTAVYLKIPDDADPALLAEACNWARDLLRYAAGDGALSRPLVSIADDAQQPLFAATARLAELDARCGIDPVQEAAPVLPPERGPAAIVSALFQGLENYVSGIIHGLADMISPSPFPTLEQAEGMVRVAAEQRQAAMFAHHLDQKRAEDDELRAEYEQSRYHGMEPEETLTPDERQAQSHGVRR